MGTPKARLRGLLPQPISSPLQKAAASEGRSPPWSATKLCLLQDLQPKSQMPRANPVRVALQCTSHREMTQDTSGVNKAWGRSRGTDPFELNPRPGGGLFHPSPRAGLAGSCPLTSMPCFPGAAQLRAARSRPRRSAAGRPHGGAGTGGTPGPPRWALGGSGLRPPAALGEKKGFSILGVLLCVLSGNT